MPAGIYKYKPHSRKTRKRMKGMNSGKKNGMWVGNKVGKVAVHGWIVRTLGKASKCFICGKTQGQIDWANRDHSYKRNIEDWVQLCHSCHTIYDIKHNNRPGSVTGVCSVAGCTRVHAAHGLCRLHYYREYRKTKNKKIYKEEICQM